jgi:hypothetical protein
MFMNPFMKNSVKKLLNLLKTLKLEILSLKILNKDHKLTKHNSIPSWDTLKVDKNKVPKCNVEEKNGVIKDISLNPPFSLMLKTK